MRPKQSFSVADGYKVIILMQLRQEQLLSEQNSHHSSTTYLTLQALTGALQFGSSLQVTEAGASACVRGCHDRGRRQRAVRSAGTTVGGGVLPLDLGFQLLYLQ